MSVRRAVDLFGKALRETGHAMDRLALTMNENEVFRSNFARNRTLMPLKDKAPVVHQDAFVAPNASVIGSVQLMESSNVCSFLLYNIYNAISWCYVYVVL